MLKYFRELKKINILAFGIAREIVGGPVTDLPFEAMTVEAIKTELEARFPRLKQLTSFMIAVNGEYATAGAMIHEGDEVAIIPPVSGG